MIKRKRIAYLTEEQERYVRKQARIQILKEKNGVDLVGDDLLDDGPNKDKTWDVDPYPTKDKKWHMSKKAKTDKKDTIKGQSAPAPKGKRIVNTPKETWPKAK